MGGSIRHALGFSTCAAATIFSDSRSSFSYRFQQQGLSKGMVNERSSS